MKTRTLSALCIFALLSLNYASAAMIKSSLENKLPDNDIKKQLVEVGQDCDATGSVSSVPPGSGSPPPTGTLPTGSTGVGSFEVQSVGALSQVGQTVNQLPAGQSGKSVNCNCCEKTEGNRHVCNSATKTKNFCLNGSIDYQKKKCVHESSSCQSSTSGQFTTICQSSTSNAQVGTLPPGSPGLCVTACLA